jgi:radical SAM superfamily enzyme with C-terminal helix-hairpin-helix motif
VKGRRVRLFLRLNTEVNSRLRILMRYHGELSEYIDQALMSFDLRSIDLIPVAVGRRTRGMTAIISGIANARLRSATRRPVAL